MNSQYPFSLIGWFLLKTCRTRGKKQFAFRYECAIKAASKIKNPRMCKKAIKWIASEFLSNVAGSYFERFVLRQEGVSASYLYEVMRDRAIELGWLSSAKLYSLKLDQQLTKKEYQKIFRIKLGALEKHEIDDPVFLENGLLVSMDEIRSCIRWHLYRGALDRVNAVLKLLNINMSDFNFTEEENKIFRLSAGRG